MPRVVDPQQRRAQLIDVTAAEIARVGLDQITLRGIARAGGWTTGIVSHYFIDKRDLLIATFRSRADGARQRIEWARAGGATGLEAIIDNALPVDDDRLTSWKVFLAFWAAAVGDDELTAIHVQRHDSFTESVEVALRAERDEGRFRSGFDLAHEARRLIALLDGVALQAVLQPDRWPPTEQRGIVEEHLAQLRDRQPSYDRPRSRREESVLGRRLSS